MKYLLFAMAAYLLLACNNNKQQQERDEWIKEKLWANVNQGLSGDAMQRVDSIRLVRVDSFTEKGLVYERIAWEKKRLDFLERELNSTLEDIEINNTMIEQEKRAGLDYTRYVELNRIYRSDTIGSKNDIDEYKLNIDTLNKVYENTPAGPHLGFYVEADVFYTFVRESDSVRIWTHLLNDGTFDTEKNLLILFKENSEYYKIMDDLFNTK